MPDTVTVIACVVAPLDHRYDPPLLAVSVTLPPAQKLVGPLAAIVAVAAAPTVTVCDALAEQPLASVTLTLYVVVATGATVIDALVAPFDHRNDVPPLAVRVTLAPAQLVLGPAIVAVGFGFTVTFTGVDAPVHPVAAVTVTL